MGTLNALDIQQDCRATAENIAERDPYYAMGSARASGNVSFPAFHKACDINHQCLKL